MRLSIILVFCLGMPSALQAAAIWNCTVETLPLERGDVTNKTENMRVKVYDGKIQLTGTQWIHHCIALQEPNDPRLSFTCEEEPYEGLIMQYVMNTKTGELKKILRQGDDLQGISYGTCKVKGAKSDLLLSHGDF